MFAVKVKIYGVLYNQSSSSAKPDFHWSPHGSLASIGRHFITTRVVHLPKRIETSLITESDQSGPNHRIIPGSARRTAIAAFLDNFG